MAKTKISEFDANPANNTDINGINVAEGCAPSGINNAIRQLMSDLKEQQTGASGDNFTVGGNLAVTGTSAFTGVATFTANPVVPTTFGVVPSGGIIMWSGSIASIPTGWLLCDGTNGTPNLRDRFIVGAGSAYAVNATGGSANAVVVSHSHTATVTDPGHFHAPPTGLNTPYLTNPFSGDGSIDSSTVTGTNERNATTGNSGSKTTGITVSNSTEGVSGTNANLPPYLALAYIMKS